MTSHSLALLACLLTAATAVECADYYASPAGRGSGTTAETPYLIADFWPHARPGDTLWLLDGTYTGSHSMIAPPEGVQGKPGAAITVKALHDGRVTVDGQGKLVPVQIGREQHWFTIEGLNACRSKRTVVAIAGSHCTVRRVCAWDAADGNTNVFGNHYCEHTLYEDCAGWGVARKTYSNSQGGNFTTYRRCWGRWEGCHRVGPKMTYSVYYNSYGNTFENCIGTWHAQRMRESHSPIGNDGKPFTNWGRGPKEPRHYSSFAVDQPYGIFGVDRIDPGKCPTHGFRLLGCLAYITAESRVDQFIGMYFQRAYDRGDIVIQDCAAIAGPGSARVLPMRLIRPVLTRFTCLAAAEPVLTEPSKVSQLVRAARIDDLPLGPHGALDAPDGADLWHRYENGVKTDQPLWPWPMNDRIKALISVDVTATVMELARVPLDRRPAAQKPPPQDR